MKILFAGGGTGGHFYPIIAIAEKINQIADQEKIIDSRLYFMSTDPYDGNALLKNRITFVKVAAGKWRVYFSFKNFIDLFKIFFGVFGAIFKVYSIYPDVVMGKGGYTSFPTLLAARIFRIPVLIHESDSVPGRVNKWSGRFARRVAISFAEAAEYFPEGKTALIGVPIRQEIGRPAKEGAFEYLDLNPSIPTLVVWGGSQGAQTINEIVLETLPDLLRDYQIIHQTGAKNLAEVKRDSAIILENHPHRDRYKAFGFFNPLALKMVAGAASLAISRAGATAIYELAAWNLPSILIPITKSHADHQRKNAYHYARSGACQVIEENNLEPSILVAEARRLLNSRPELEKMREGARSFAKPDAAEKIAREIINIALEHEK